MKELLQLKAGLLDDKKRTDRALAQQELDRHFRGQATVRDIKDGYLTITTRSAPIASELRMQQMMIIETIHGHTKQPIHKLRILIR